MTFREIMRFGNFLLRRMKKKIKCYERRTDKKEESEKKNIVRKETT